ncbi:MAG TPA: hypothetical protein VHT73_17415 [Thermodesulfobacteriota bacterium]|nr:hypothetical protein [Thermodesulfobacteriota bacterium]
MRKLLLSTLLATGLTLSGVSVFAAGEEEQAPTEQEAAKQQEAPPVGSLSTEEMAKQLKEVEGEVVNYDEKLSSLTIKTEDGQTMPLVVKHPTHLEDIHPGDQVSVHVIGTTALSISKAAEPEDVAAPGESGPAPIEEEAPAPEETAPEAQ